MASGHDWRTVRAAAGPAREDVPDLVDGDGASRVPAPSHEEVASLAVEIGQCETAHPALPGCANPGELHQARPQTVAIDLEIVHAPLLVVSDFAANSIPSRADEGTGAILPRRVMSRWPGAIELRPPGVEDAGEVRMEGIAAEEPVLGVPSILADCLACSRSVSRSY